MAEQEGAAAGPDVRHDEFMEEDDSGSESGDPRAASAARLAARTGRTRYVLWVVSFVFCLVPRSVWLLWCG